MSPTEQDFAWAVGLFEGEGCVGFYRSPSLSGGGHARSLTLRTTDEDVIRKFHRVVEVGVVHGPRWDGNDAHKPIWQWRVGRWGDLEPLLRRMLPMLCARRSEAAQRLLANPPLTRTGRVSAEMCGRGHRKDDPRHFYRAADGRLRCRTCRAITKGAHS